MGSPQVTELDPSVLTSVTARSKGGTLGDLVRHLAASGEPCALDAAGGQAWIQSPRHVLFRLPVECMDPVTAAAAETLLRQPGIWLVNYLQPAETPEAATCVDYVCRDAGYHTSRLAASPRRSVRHGLRNLVVRLCTWDEWSGQGFPAFADTERRHGNPEATDRQFQALARRWRGTPFLDVWGAWRGDALVAWMTLLKVDDWALIDLARSRTEALQLNPNNAVLYAATWSMLAQEGRRYVSYGTSSLQVGVNEASLHAFKIGMGYQAIPARRVFRSRAAYRPLLESRLVARGLRRLSATWPRSSALRKLAGMVQLQAGGAAATTGQARTPE